MPDKENIHYDPEGEQIIRQQLTEAYQSGVIDSVFENDQHNKDVNDLEP
ncbi:MAG: hypothetical protein ACO1OC_08840 [Tuberibacillus sp.]